jgi:hypothetical protein
MVITNFLSHGSMLTTAWNDLFKKSTCTQQSTAEHCDGTLQEIGPDNAEMVPIFSVQSEK